MLYFHSSTLLPHGAEAQSFNTIQYFKHESDNKFNNTYKKKQYVQSIRMHDTSNLIIYHAEMAMLITSGKQSCHWTSGHRWMGHPAGSEAGQWTSGDKPLLRQVQLHTDKRWTKHTWTNQIMEGTHMLANAKLRASIIAGCKLTKWWGGGERGGERGEAGCKLTVGLGIRTKKVCERDKWTIY